MKNMKKLFSLVLALVMMMALVVTAGATTLPAETDNVGTNEPADGKWMSITSPSDIDKDAVNVYQVYKVFNAVGNGTNISYTPLDSKKDIEENPLPTGFTLTDGGNVVHTGNATTLTQDEITAIASYVEGDTPIAVVRLTGANATKYVTLESDGYYYVTTTTGSLVNITSSNPTADVDDKNTVPTVVKKTSNHDSAIVEAGQTLDFSVVITVGKGCKSYVLHDTMNAGLELVEGSLKINGKTFDQLTEEATDEIPNIVKSVTPAEGETITVAFIDDIAEGTTITVTYQAKVTSAALSGTGATNGAKVTYGNGNETPTDEVKVYNAKYTVTKVDGNNKPLAGAGFVLKKTVKDDDGNDKDLYYKKTTTDGKVTITWEPDKADATELVSKDEEGGNVLVFDGLTNGTYTLVEKTVPAGYNQAADKEFTIAATDGEGEVDVTKLEMGAIIANQTGRELPATGGIGTTVFTVTGAVLMIGAAVLFLTKKRSEV